MSQEKALSFEEVNAHVEKTYNEKHHGVSTAATGNLCSIYTVVRPILILISQLPLIPKKWKDAIKTLIAVLDTLCPQP